MRSTNLHFTYLLTKHTGLSKTLNRPGQQATATFGHRTSDQTMPALQHVLQTWPAASGRRQLPHDTVVPSVTAPGSIYTANFLIQYVAATFSALTLLVGHRKGIRPVKKRGVGLLVVTFWPELCTSYSSSCYHSPPPSPLNTEWRHSGTH